MKISKNLVIGILIVLVIIPLVMATLSTLIPHTTNNPSGSGYVTEGTYTIGTYTALTETCIGEVQFSSQEKERVHQHQQELAPLDYLIILLVLG